MKKLLYCAPILALGMLAASCSNEDITVESAVTIKVNPATVVSSLYERTPGDLSSIDRGYSLNVDLYIYNEAGVLVTSTSEQYSDYTHVMSTSLQLPAGDYTAVAMTHVTGSNINYWNIAGTDRLDTFTVTDEGYIGGNHKILGLSSYALKVTESNSREHSINVQCAGAVAFINIQNWNRYSNIEEFELLANKSCDNLTLDSKGQPTYSVETSQNLQWRMFLMDYDPDYSGGYSYSFMFPCTNISMRFAATLTSGSGVYLGSGCVADIEKGKSYIFRYDVTSEQEDWLIYNGSNRPAAPTESFEVDGLLYCPDSNSVKIARK
ncbi:MAG: FimB/Mfa2 family fimbrial subunit [Muribaculaceae bacterium]|nr:FimB/Mfa2 family fimbrial subunit [Muribaculaceae bacterium]